MVPIKKPYHFHYDYEMQRGELCKEDGEQKILIHSWGMTYEEE